MAKWTLPEGRKPLPDEWFREKAQMQERIEELEDKYAKTVSALLVVNALLWAEDPKGMIDGCSKSELRDLVLRIGELARKTLAELKGEK